MWTFDEAGKYLDDTAPQGKSIYGLGRISHLLELLSHPENAFRKVTIVGTNGKGSVLCFLDGLLRSHGINAACHIKPHLESVTERIRLNGIDSTPDQFAQALYTVKKAVDESWTRDDRPTYFELVFAAFLCAAKSSVAEIALLEAGLGGRYDAVNAVDSPLAILASVDYDHTELLGDTLEKIATEKLQVLRKGSVLACQKNNPEVIHTVKAIASEIGSRVVYASDHDGLTLNSDGTFSYSSPAGEVDNIRLGLTGPYQPENASLALLAFEILSRDIYPELFPDGISADNIRYGLQIARLPGRWEKVCQKDYGRCWILDGAHNPAGLKRVLDEYARITDGKGTVVIGMKKDKKAVEIMEQLTQSAAHVLFTDVPGIECYEPGQLSDMLKSIMPDSAGSSQIQVNCADSIIDVLESADAVTDSGCPILVTGSLYLVGAVRNIIKGDSKEKPIPGAKI